MDPMTLLRNEHRLIEKAIVAASRLRDKMKSGTQIQPKIFWMTIDFWSTYADIVHHGKEEQVLFPLVEERATSATLIAIIDRLVKEHTQLLHYIGELREAARPFFKGNHQAREQVLESLDGYLQIIKPHIKLEDQELFPKIPDLFSREELKEIEKEFQIMDERTGPKVHTFYEERVKKLLEK